MYDKQIVDQIFRQMPQDTLLMTNHADGCPAQTDGRAACQCRPTLIAYTFINEDDLSPGRALVVDGELVQ